jgi:hypothetical protein
MEEESWSEKYRDVRIEEACPKERQIRRDIIEIVKL